jgi:quercetin dioxygenase-like cupin family protein
MNCQECDNCLEKAKPVELAELVQYAEGSIVSRTLLEAEAGDLSLFAFSKGQKLSEHSAPFDAAVQVLDGVAEIVIAGKPHRLGKGQFVIMPANVPHAVKAPENFKMLLSMIKA